jgi:hypothetical protein
MWSGRRCVGAQSRDWEFPLTRADRQLAGRSDAYNNLALAINDNLMLNAGTLGGSPKVLRPFIGPLFKFAIWRQIEKFKPMWRSVYDERVRMLENFSPDDPDHTEPRDIIQLELRWAQRERPGEVCDFEGLTRRLCALNFAVMHQTALGMTNLILNVIGSDAEFNTIAVLRDEAQRVLYADAVAGQEPSWTKAKLAQLVRMDSVSRETMRLHSFGGRATFRYAKEEVETPEGHVLHKGNVICFLGQPIHTDGELFPDPFQFDPFRYSRERESEAAENGDAKGGKLSFVTTGTEFLPFGHGPHSW